MKIKKKLFFGLALSPTILVAPIVVSCTDTDDKKTKEINKENIEKYSNLVNEIQLAYQKSNPNTPIFEGKTIADIFTETVDKLLETAGLSEQGEDFVKYTKETITYSINVSVEESIPFITKIVDEAKKNPDVDILTIFKKQENIDYWLKVLETVVNKLRDYSKKTKDKLMNIMVDIDLKVMPDASKSQLLKQYKMLYNDSTIDAQYDLILKNYKDAVNLYLGNENTDIKEIINTLLSSINSAA